jgi:hypothetical protein
VLGRQPELAPIDGFRVSSPTIEGRTLATSPGRLQPWTESGRTIDAEIVAAAALLSAVLVVGLATAADYGLTVDEFNTDDYGPKALAWYTSGFRDRSQARCPH